MTAAHNIEMVCLALVEHGVLEIDHTDDEGKLYFRCR